MNLHVRAELKREPLQRHKFWEVWRQLAQQVYISGRCIIISDSSDILLNRVVHRSTADLQRCKAHLWGEYTKFYFAEQLISTSPRTQSTSLDGILCYLLSH